jgi:SAM-dependent methyltransferase
VDLPDDARRKRRVLTKNRMGWSSAALSELSVHFVDFCRSGACPESSPALDLGAGYGTASLAAWECGAHVIANDLDPSHLVALAGRPRLSIAPGRFPRDISFEENSLGAVHASSVLHFLTGNQLEYGLKVIARWLRPGGKLFVQAATPWQQPFADFVPEFHRRLESGVKWPGFVERIGAWSTHKQISLMPKAVHLLDTDTLASVTLNAGLDIDRLWYYRRADLPVRLRLDGRESVGLIASKPL